MSCIFALDSSGPVASLAIETADGSVFETTLDADQSHNELIPEVFAELLQRSKLASRDLTGLIVGAGPGSFTGLRIGFSFMKGLAFALRVPLTTISSFRASVHCIGRPYELAVTYADARGGNYYLAVYRKDPAGQISGIVEPRLIEYSNTLPIIESLASELNISGDQIVLVSQDASLASPYAEVLPRNISRGLLDLRPRGEEAFDLKQLVAIEPQYLRKVAASTIKERELARLAKKA